MHLARQQGSVALADAALAASRTPLVRVDPPNGGTLHFLQVTLLWPAVAVGVPSKQEDSHERSYAACGHGGDAGYAADTDEELSVRLCEPQIPSARSSIN